MRRFFSTHHDGPERLTLSAEDVKHITAVLRLRAGDEILICDGRSTDYLCRISEASKSNVSFDVIGSSPNPAEPGIHVTIYQGLPKSDKMDLIVQKCVELGVFAMVPVECERSVAKIKYSSTKKTARWQSIAEAAAKQSGRGIIPTVGPVISLDEALLQMASYDTALMPYELERTTSLQRALKACRDVSSLALFIGPEGGISHKEAERAKAAGIVPVSLGRRILRCETAGFTALILSLALIGDYE